MDQRPPSQRNTPSCGCLVHCSAIVGLTLCGVIYISLSQGAVLRHDKIIMITIAAYTFYKLTMAAVRAVKQKGNASPLLAVIRNIGYADAAASVMSLQMSMFASFGTPDDPLAHTLNIATGAVVCLFIWILGVRLLAKGLKNRTTRDCSGG